ncbi:DEAD/DEAH box helicase [Cerasicoccus maritimus]|uniref:DEAD/DEAH box helicase n=1 Tax=Cerasicoccus maritimus TaxID=490089 RepID=UPI0028529085|nr:SNF2-related protein [Cerasicoccus maritimus]
MNHRISQRVYSDAALDHWLSRLMDAWEQNFNADAIDAGRRLYRKGCIRQVELSAEDAIVHLRLDDASDVYVVLDWEKDKVQARSSIEDRELREIIAVAALYEIEELVAEEVGALPPEEKSKAPTAEAETVEESSAVELQPKPKRPATAKPVPKAPPSRKLVLKFSAIDSGLAMNVVWRQKNGQEQRAFGPNAPSADMTSAEEREDLIRLTSGARRDGFRYQADAARYELQQLDRLPGFVRTDLPKWEQFFTVEIDPDVECLAEGVQEIDVAVEIDEALAGGDLDINWKLTLGSSRLTDKERRRLLRKIDEGPVLLPGRGLVRINREQAKAIAETGDSMAVISGRAPRYLLFSFFAQEAVKLDLSPELELWRKQLFHPDPGVNGAPKFLRGYQQHGVHWMQHLFGCSCHGLLADEMGLGKTLQVLSLLSIRPVKDKPSLIVCPASVVPVWQQEVQRFFPHMRTEALGKGQSFDTHDDASILWLASYTQLRRHRSQLDDKEFAYVVLDEAQFIKNPDAKSTQACLALKADHRLALTGTPLENRFLDVWTIFRFLMPGLLGMRRRFEESIHDEGSVAMERIRTQLAPFILRRTKKEVAKELPDKVELELVCPLTDLQRSEYLRIATEGVTRFGDNLQSGMSENAMGLLTLLTRLRQTCCDPGLLPWQNSEVSQSGKLNMLRDRLREIIANGHKAVVFSQFVTLLDRAKDVLQQEFPELPLYELTGKTIDRQKPVAEFQKQKGPGIFLVSLRAGGSGITLHAADYVFLLDPWWNPAVEAQAIDRVHRIGQKRVVFVYRMITSGTIEQRIQKLKAEKRELFEQAVGGASSGDDFTSYFQSLSDLTELLDENSPSPPPELTPV